MAKKKTNGQREGVERARYTKPLPVPADPEQVKQNAQELATTIRARDAVQEARREAAARYRKQLAHFDERLKELAKAVDKRITTAPIMCVERLIVETNEVHVIRLDTGEIVERRTAEASDRQDQLSIDTKVIHNPSLADVGKSKPDAIPAGKLEDDNDFGGAA